MAQKSKSAASLESALEAMANAYLEKHDPVKKAERQKIRGKLQTALQLGPGLVVPKPGTAPDEKPQRTHPRRPLRARLRHQIMLRHQGQCAHIDGDNRRCQNRRHLDIHHIVAVAKGGADELSNLTLLCTGHHRVQHHGDSTK